MPVNGIYGNQSQTDIAAYAAQQKQRTSLDAEREVSAYRALANNAATEDVRVSLTSREKRAEFREMAVEAARTVAQQRTEESRNTETEAKRGIQAYENANRMAENNNTRPENATRKGINRIAGT